VRYVVLLFGLLGVGGSGFIVYKWGTEWLNRHEDVETSRNTHERKLNTLVWRSGYLTPESQKLNMGVTLDEYNKQNAVFYDRQRMLPLVIGGMFLAWIGISASFRGYGISGALLLLTAAAGPAVFDPLILVYTGCLILAGLCALFIRAPRPAPVKKPASLDD
jgi:hypothetical protein